MKAVALVGAGNIAGIHADILRSFSDVRVAAVVDPHIGRAEALAARFSGAKALAGVEPLLEAEPITHAHVLVPPDLHLQVASELVARGIHTLIEKPMAASTAECRALLKARENGGGGLYVNHNFAFHPAFSRLLQLLRSGRHGSLTEVSCTYAMPLRQLEARQFHHWMFRSPANLLLEQAVHPLSQVFALAGPASEAEILAEQPLRLNAAQVVPSAMSGLLECRDAIVRFHFRFGASHPVWEFSALCSDAVITADILRNRVVASDRGQRLEPLDNVLAGRRLRGAMSRQDWTNLANYALSMLKLKGNTDPYFLSMRASIRAFYDGDDRQLVNRPEAAAALVTLCEQIAGRAIPAAGAAIAPRRKRALDTCDAVVLGGTGFIGTHIVRELVAAEKSVRVVARHTDGLTDDFDHPSISLVRGDLTSPTALVELVRGAKYVINAAAQPLGATWAETEALARAAAAALVGACANAGVLRLVHLSSTAALYLGAAGARITGSDGVDPHPEYRPAYSRAKALSESLLLELCKSARLPICILRPAIVVGDGGTPFHTGVGLVVNVRHFVGWNDGRNALPFVLARDVALAAIAACTKPIPQGACYNLAGDVRLTAREYVEELARSLGRPFIYHPQLTNWLWLTEMGKHLIKRTARRASDPPRFRDLRSRAFLSTIDTSDVKRDLDWAPVGDKATFINQAITVHHSKPPDRK